VAADWEVAGMETKAWWMYEPWCVERPAGHIIIIILVYTDILYGIQYRLVCGTPNTGYAQH
jgi:hypothetical protein